MSTTTGDLRARAAAAKEEIVGWRRHLHAHPELSGEETQTAAFVADKLRAWGYDVRTGVGGHGVVADLRTADGPLVALRADMDALPVHEENELPYRSTRPGVMHACGHDAHTAMLLGAAKLLREHTHPSPRSVRLLFQPAEERFPGGAQPMIAAGCLQDVGRVFGLHIWSQAPSGTVGVRSGPAMASPTGLHIVVHGRGGHAAMPQDCVDPVVAAAHIITALQTVVSRNVGLTDQAVVSVTQLNAGTADNVIAPHAELIGTVRTFDNALRERVCERIRTIAEHTARALGAHADVTLKFGYPTLVNDERATNEARAAAERVGFIGDNLQTPDPVAGGEDFAYFCEQTPGAFLFLGAGDEAKQTTFPHHHPKFNIDEDVLPSGAALLAALALQPTTAASG